VIGELDCVVLDCPDVRALGATLLDATTSDRGWRVYADPARHPFCLIGHVGG
jgi:hypothetical protein